MDSWLDTSSLTVSTLLTKVEEGLNSVDNLAAERLQNRSGLIAGTDDLSDADAAVSLGVDSRRRRVQRAGKERAVVGSSSSVTELSNSSKPPSPSHPDTASVSGDQLFDFRDGAAAVPPGVGYTGRPVSSSTPRVGGGDTTSRHGKRLSPPSDRAITTGSSSDAEVNSGGDGDRDAVDDPGVLRMRLTQVSDENKLLRREVAALTDEVSSFSTRMRSTQAALSDTRERLAASERKVVKAQSARRDDQLRADQLVAAAEEQAAARTALEDQLVIADQRVIDLEAEKEIILKDHADSSAAHDGALTSLRSEVEALKSARATTQGSLEASRSATETQLEQLRVVNTKLQRQVDTALAEAAANAKALHVATTRTAAVEQQYKALEEEFTEYRTKATQVLQRKERQIGTLQASGGADAHTDVNADAGGLGERNDAATGNERAQLVAELTAARELAKQLQAELTDLEQQQQDDGELAAGQIRELEQLLAVAEAGKAEVEQALAHRMRELASSLEESEQQRDLLQQEAERSVAELHRLHGEVTRLSQTAEGQATAELEEKLRALTGNVVRKQAQIEALTADKTSLALQLEEMERQKRYETRVNIPTRAHSRRDDELSGDGGRVRTLKSIFGEMDPGSGKLQATVGSAVHVLDAVSIRIGIFLRRYPAARLMVILYMILLHLWVMIVIFTYTPEMHTGLEDGLHDHHPVAPDHVSKVDSITFGRAH